MILVVFGNFGGSCCSCHDSFPLLEGGNAVRFCLFVFSCLVWRLLSFLSILLFLGSLFGNFFGSELLFLGIGVGRVYSGAVLPMFLLYYLAFRPRKGGSEKILFWSGPFFE